MSAWNFSPSPNRGVGPLRFGMSRTDVRTLLGPPDSTFRRSAESNAETDAYDDRGLFLIFGTGGQLEAVEISAPDYITLDGLGAIDRPFSEVLTFLQRLDANVVVDDSGATSLALGVGVYCPHAREDRDALVESAIVFRDGYYDDP